MTSLKPMEILIYPELKDALEWVTRNPEASQQEKVDVAGNALRNMDREKLLYMAAVGLAFMPVSFGYEMDVKTKIIPSVAKNAVSIGEKRAKKARAEKNIQNLGKGNNSGVSEERKRELAEYAGKLKLKSVSAQIARIKIEFPDVANISNGTIRRWLHKVK